MTKNNVLFCKEMCTSFASKCFLLILLAVLELILLANVCTGFASKCFSTNFDSK